ncbi:hypothetical protein Bbelb_318140 [Branchiostoma belcheri]|nr:hypothetical protein Bbelb_318140 [Branchiostoma belcheri]
MSLALKEPPGQIKLTTTFYRPDNNSISKDNHERFETEPLPECVRWLLTDASTTERAYKVFWNKQTKVLENRRYSPARMKEEVEDISVEEVNVTRYTRLRVKTIFQQYRYDVDNFHRRNRVYRAISGLLTYGLRRGPPGTYYIDNEDLLDVVRDAYPSSEDVNWMLTNQDNRPTKEDTVQAPVALGDPHLGVLIYPGQLIDAELVRDGASASGYHRKLMHFYFYFYGFDTCHLPQKTILSCFARSEGKISYIPVWSHSVVAARTARTLAMAAPVPVLRGDVTLVGCSLMEEDEDAAAEREEYREEWAMFEEDMAYLAHLDRIVDAEDSSEDEVEEARRLYDQHVQVMNQFSLHGRRNIICPVVTDARCRASLESSVVSRDELQVSAELIVSQDRCFASTHVLYVDKHRCCTREGIRLFMP